VPKVLRQLPGAKPNTHRPECEWGLELFG